MSKKHEADDDEQYYEMLANAPQFHEMLRRANEEIKAGKGIPAKEFWKQVREQAKANSTSRRSAARRG